MNDHNNLFDFSNLSNTTDSHHVDISSLNHDPVILRSPPQTMTVSADSSDTLQQFMNNGSYEQQIIHPSTELNQGFDISNSVNLPSDNIHHQTINNHSMIMSHAPKPVHLNSDSQEVSVQSNNINNNLEISYFNQFNGLNNFSDPGLT
ncbi:MAG: hypothetical protein EAZ87_19005 [Nostocales cyanobacterium]|nr:MAG: hypothetical protein EAZ87_19005 [Nostocales cyanobacterium]